MVNLKKKKIDEIKWIKLMFIFDEKNFQERGAQERRQVYHWADTLYLTNSV